MRSDHIEADWRQFMAACTEPRALRRVTMRVRRVDGLAGSARRRAGKARAAILLWLLGVPLPLILLYFLFRGCA